ncbi:ABC transporter ATP-binding protein [Alteromonas sediminis]|uniref:ABC transporter ATP-binding protein n=2 Tax=Alteromonas sediminis TaxID=2259342 RepID=A0A3N5Y5N8_9ALTE|nr:ABC transporter ATP-binding protein [Alteromonas sediminis]
MDAKYISHIELHEVAHSFVMNEEEVLLFNDLNLLLSRGSAYAITGPSGAGKSSLLMLMSGLEQPSQGRVSASFEGQHTGMQDVREHIGFIFQQFHLLPELSALANVALPLKLRGVKDAEAKAKSWLAKVGLGHRLTHKPKQLSGGEQQRVAIARALVFEPGFIFADEPTGNLDAKSAADVADILFSCCKENGAGLVLVTHSDALAARAEHVFRLANGACHVEK